MRIKKTYPAVYLWAVVLPLALVLQLVIVLPGLAGDEKTTSEPGLISHRGLGFGHPENSLAAIGAAMENGVQGVEIDLRTTADGHIVLLHDPQLERTTTGKGLVRGKKWSELKTLRLLDEDGRPSVSGIPDFAAVLRLVKNHPGLKLALDLKEVDAVAAAKMVLQHGVEKQALFFVADPMDTGLSQSITALDPDLNIIVNMLGWWKIEDIPLFAARALGAKTLFASEWFFPHRGFHRLADEGIEVVVYLWGTKDLPERYRRAVELGAAYVSCDDPKILLALEQRSGKEKKARP